VVMLIVGKHLDCSLVIDAYVDVGIGSSRRGGDKVEAFIYGM
jgi:hypothetical protein